MDPLVYKPLSAEQVFSIADPDVTSESPDRLIKPTHAVEIKAKLISELNEKITRTNDEEMKNIYRKILNRVLNYETTPEEDKEIVDNLIKFNDCKKDSLLAHRDQLTMDIESLELKIDEHKKSVSEKVIDNKPIKSTGKIDDYEDEIKTIVDKINHIDSIINGINESDLKSINIIDYPAGSLSQRMAESVKLYQDINNDFSKPQIMHFFENISKINSVDELFIDESGKIGNMALIIYRSSQNFGHWCCITRSNDLKSVTYFNSYGSYIDEAIESINEEFLESSKQNFPFLLKLLSNSDYEVHWNDFPLQLMDNKTATCGYWCGMWMRCNELGKTINQFIDVFREIPADERDNMIVKITKVYLKL